MSVTLHQVEHKIGKRPDGDPAALLKTAETLKKVADELDAQSKAMRATHLKGSGRVIERANKRVESRCKELIHAERELKDLVLTLNSRAVGLKNDQDDWARRATGMGWKP